MITLIPYDVFLLSDGRGFTKGESTFRESVFFINPIPILGSVNKITGKKLNIEFISLIKKDKLYFKAPITLKKIKKEDRIISPKLKKLRS
ncbi:MAG: CRISPR-associated protein, partial [Thermoproteota archaeon]